MQEICLKQLKKPFYLVLSELENSYTANQHILEAKADELNELERVARRLLEDISQQVALYSTCS